MVRVLVADDEADVLDNITTELELEGYETGKAGDGVEAILKILDGGWDVLLMDIRMPNLDGVNALKIIHRMSPNLPVIMFTGQAGRGEMLTSTQSGAYTCLLKPVSLDKLIGILEKVTPSEMPTNNYE